MNIIICKYYILKKYSLINGMLAKIHSIYFYIRFNCDYQLKKKEPISSFWYKCSQNSDLTKGLEKLKIYQSSMINCLLQDMIIMEYLKSQ